MRTELKKAIIDFMFANINYFGLTNHTVDKFRQYIYTPEGEHCFGGKEVSDFIHQSEKLIKSELS